MKFGFIPINEELLGVPISLFKQEVSDKTKVSVAEAYNIWNALRSRYASIERMEFAKNFVHDRDLSMMMQRFIEAFKNEIRILEDIAMKLEVKAPDRPPESMEFTVEICHVTDRFIFRTVVNEINGELFSLIRGVNTTLLNDPLRGQFGDFFLKHLRLYADLLRYGRLKAWADIIPDYKMTGVDTEKQLSVCDADHLWAHINMRHTQVYHTRFLSGFVQDKDFRYLLEQGADMLNHQLTMLVNKAKEFNLPLPSRPPISQPVSIDLEIFEDKFGFALVLRGIQNTVFLHAWACVETVLNEDIWDIFYDLLLDELTAFDTLLKYGKAKGWAPVPIIY